MDGVRITVPGRHAAVCIAMISASVSFFAGSDAERDGGGREYVRLWLHGWEEDREGRGSEEGGREKEIGKKGDGMGNRTVGRLGFA